jgi:putative heme-binding domain-containing protein
LRLGTRHPVRFASVACRTCAYSAVLLLLPSLLFAQAPKNPLAGNAQAIREGASVFRINCAMCHGLNARGGSRGPDLARGVFTHGGADAQIFHTITHGVPGTLMPANDISATETWQVIAYLRSLAPKKPQRPLGDPEAGEKLFFGNANCSLCHMVRGRGGRLGPDLSRIGSERSPRYLLEKIRNPNIDVAPGMMPPDMEWPIEYRTVTVVTKSGQTITGVLRNEDSFTIQLMDNAEIFHFFQKSDLESITYDAHSMMPPFGPDLLSERQLHDLVAYLETLRGETPEAAK